MPDATIYPTGYDMMFGDANKTKEFKKLDEINGVKVKGRGYIANNGELAGEFFSPYVPLDQGFSFYDAYSKIPIMEFEGEEFSVFEEYKPPVETIDPIEEEETIEDESNKRPLKEFADEQNLKMPTLRIATGESLMSFTPTEDTAPVKSLFLIVP